MRPPFAFIRPAVIFTAMALFFCSAHADDTDYNTLIQAASQYHPKSNVQVGLVLTAAAEGQSSIEGIPALVESWRSKGYRTFGFAALARVYDYYMNGGWKDLEGMMDTGGHEGEIQRNRFGGKFGPHEFMMMPSLRLMDQKKLWAKAFIDAGVSQSDC